MLFFKSKAERELETILKELQNYLSNNYKDKAHEYRKLLGERAELYHNEGLLSDRAFLHYDSLYRKYTADMKDYHH